MVGRHACPPRRMGVGVMNPKLRTGFRAVNLAVSWCERRSEELLGILVVLLLLFGAAIVGEPRLDRAAPTESAANR